MYVGLPRTGEQMRVRWLGPGSRIRDTELAGEAIHEFADDRRRDARRRARAVEPRGCHARRRRPHRRIHEVLLVATDATGRLVGVVERVPAAQPPAEARPLVLPRARRRRSPGGNVAVQLALRGIELLEHRYVTGEDRRGVGVCMEIEHPGSGATCRRACGRRPAWSSSATVRMAAHVRVRYFPGAEAPLPPS